MFFAKILVVLAVVAIAGAFRHFSTRLHRNGHLTQQFLFGSPEPPKNSSSEKKKDGGLLGGMGNMMESMKKAQEIAKKAEELNKQLAATVISGSDSSGEVIATFTGLGIPIEIKIPDAIVEQGSEAVSKAATEAMKDGHGKSTSNMMGKMQELYAGVPGMGPKA